MIPNTSSTDINIGTRILFLPAPSVLPRPPKPDARRNGLQLAADPSNPTPAEIERMTKKVVDEILRGLSDTSLDE